MQAERSQARVEVRDEGVREPQFRRARPQAPAREREDPLEPRILPRPSCGHALENGGVL
jgi:hypothetical protein